MSIKVLCTVKNVGRKSLYALDYKISHACARLNQLFNSNKQTSLSRCLRCSFTWCNVLNFIESVCSDSIRFDLMQYRFTIWLPKWIARRKNKWLSLTYVEATFSMSSGILNSLDGAVVLLARTQNVTKTRRFCVVLINTNAVLSVSLQPREENTNKFEIRTSNFYLSVFLNFSIRFFYLFI